MLEVFAAKNSDLIGSIYFSTFEIKEISNLVIGMGLARFFRSPISGV